MLVSIIPIGNSKGIRLPKAILEQLDIQDELELDVKDKALVLKPIHKKPRSDWEAAFKSMHEKKEDLLLIKDEVHEKDFEWEW